MDDIKVWNLKLISDMTDIMNEIKLFKLNTKYLLNIENKTFTFIEMLVYELAMYHIKRLNLNEDLFIEFFIENITSSKMDIESDKNVSCVIDQQNSDSPIITTITYLNNNDIPDILTNIDIDSYKYKNIINNSYIGFSFPKLFKHISFNGGKYYHGIYNIFNNNTDIDKRITLKINIWNKIPNNSNYYSNDIFDFDILNNKIHHFSKNEKIINIFEEINNTYKMSVKEDIIDEFYENILYKHYYNFDHEIHSKLASLYNNFNFLLIEKKEIIIKNKIKQELDNSSRIFLQRFKFIKFYNEFVCNYIINQSLSFFNNDNIVSTYNNYKSLDIDNVPSIMNLILTSFQLVIDNIKTSFCLKNKNSYNIEKVFIIKNNTSILNDFFNDNTTICINILLNSNFEGGNLGFDDELEYNLNVGDLIIYSGKNKRSYLPVTTGTQYLLVGLINIYNEI